MTGTLAGTAVTLRHHAFEESSEAGVGNLAPTATCGLFWIALAGTTSGCLYRRLAGSADSR
jgi:hypothetical protein